MEFSGAISLSKAMTKSEWDLILSIGEIEETNQAAMTNPMTGDLVPVDDRAHFLASAINSGGRAGVIRCLRVDGVEIEFEGQGDEFSSLIKNIARELNASITQY